MKNTRSAFLTNQVGMSIVEVLVATVIFSLLVTFYSSGLSQLSTMTFDGVEMSNLDKRVNSIMDNIRSNPGRYQALYLAGDESRENFFSKHELPMAWSMREITLAENCPKCPGRFGFVLQPMASMPGIYKATLRITLDDWGDEHRDTQFLVLAR